MPVSTSLRGRVPGQTIIGHIVSAQQDQPPRSIAARIFGGSPLAPRARHLYRAALGELAVGEMLDQLGPRWDILHVVPVGDGLIDHLVIGPPGVFAITTANYPAQEVRISGDSMTVGGETVDDIPDVRRVAHNAAERLSAAAGRPVVVEPMIVVIDSGKLVVRDEPAELTVIPSKQLLKTLIKLDRTMAGAVVAYISDIAERATTWDATATAPEEALRLSHDFADLREQVRAATQTRIFWGVVGFAVICATAWISTATIVEQLLGQ
jgi:hypothetical protein